MSDDKVTATEPELLSQEQVDITHLGSKYPFSDDELLKLYHGYHTLAGGQVGRGSSFLRDWAVACVIIPTDETKLAGSPDAAIEAMKEERFLLMQAIESKILPPGFSEQLETAAFSKDQDSINEERVQPSTGNETEDEIIQKRIEEDRLMALERFFQGASNVGRRGGRHAISVMFDFCVVETESTSSDTESRKVASLSQFLNLAYRLSLAAAFLEAAKTCDDVAQWIPKENIDETAFSGLRRSLVDFVKRKRETLGRNDEEDLESEQGLVKKLDLQEFVENAMPVLSSVLPTFMHHVFFPEKPYPQSRTAFQFPRLLEESAFFEEASSPLLFSFASLSTSLGGSWHRLYTSSVDGLSFNRLQNALLGYGGPTLLVIRSISDGIFGAFTASPWKESKDFYGSSDCFLYQLTPMTAVYMPTGSGTNYMYCNSKTRIRGSDHRAHGIGFGGTIDQPRLFISETFEDCLAAGQDLTFESGLLLPKIEDFSMQKKFDIDSVEVWGVGGDEVVAEALGARNRQRAITEANLRKARKVDKAAFLDDFRSGMLDSKAFSYRDQIRGRADAVVDERHQNAYVYEK